MTQFTPPRDVDPDDSFDWLTAIVAATIVAALILLTCELFRWLELI